MSGDRDRWTPTYLRTESRNSREWLDANGAFLFGKHEGETVARVKRDDPGYLRWIVETVEDICEGDREVIEVALRRRA